MKIHQIGTPLMHTTILVRLVSPVSYDTDVVISKYLISLLKYVLLIPTLLLDNIG